MVAYYRFVFMYCAHFTWKGDFILLIFCDDIFQDISYYQCIEICGQQDMVVAAIKHLTSSDIGTVLQEIFLLT